MVQNPLYWMAKECKHDQNKRISIIEARFCHAVQRIFYHAMHPCTGPLCPQNTYLQFREILLHVFRIRSQFARFLGDFLAVLQGVFVGLDNVLEFLNHFLGFEDLFFPLLSKFFCLQPSVRGSVDLFLDNGDIASHVIDVARVSESGCCVHVLLVYRRDSFDGVFSTL